MDGTLNYRESFKRKQESENDFLSSLLWDYNVATMEKENKADLKNNCTPRPDDGDPSQERDKPSLFKSDYLLLSLYAIFIGAIAAYGTIAFRFGFTAIQGIFYQFSRGDIYTAAGKLPWWQVLLAPTIGGLVIGLIAYRFLPGRRPYGPADVIQATKKTDGKISVREGLMAAAVSCSSLGVGASTGLYGPVVHLGGSLGSWLSQSLKLPRTHTLTLLSCGVASGIASSFNTPIGGVIFAHEVMLGHYALSSFAPITIASVVGTAVMRYHMGNAPLFLFTETQIQHVYEYSLFALVGFMSAILAVIYMRSMLKAEDLVKETTLPRWVSPMVGGVLIGMIAIVFPQILGLGNESINAAINGIFPLWLLLALIPMKILATSICVSFGFGGGIFGPSLFLGAMLGGATGTIFNELLPGVVSHTQIYIVVGMAALISRVIGAPITTILLVFEMTNSYSVTTAVMIGAVVANITSYRFFAPSFFHQQLYLRGVDPDEGREVELLKSIKIRDVMSTRFQTIPMTATISEVEAILFSSQVSRENALPGSTRPSRESVRQNKKDLETVGSSDHERRKKAGSDRRKNRGDYSQRSHKYQDLCIVKENGKLVGHITMFDLMQSKKVGETAPATAGAMASMPDLILEADMDINEAMGLLANFIGISIPVVDNHKSGRIIGIIYESTIINAYNHAVEEARTEERGMH